MADHAVVEAIESYLKAQFTDCKVIGVLDEGDAAKPPPKGADFVSVEYPIAESEQISIGAPGTNVYRDEGTIRVVVSIDRQTQNGRKVGLERCAVIAALLRAKNIGPVVTFAPSTPVFDDRNDEGNYHVFSFSTPYHHDIFA